MLVLLDQGTPVPVALYLPRHTVRTASQQGWATLGNGELLAVAETDGFDVFVTTDKNLRYQQNLSARHIAIVVIMHGQAESRRGSQPVAELSLGSQIGVCRRHAALAIRPRSQLDMEAHLFVELVGKPIAPNPEPRPPDPVTE